MCRCYRAVRRLVPFSQQRVGPVARQRNAVALLVKRRRSVVPNRSVDKGWCAVDDRGRAGVDGLQVRDDINSERTSV